MAESEPSATLFTNRLYDKMKFIALVFLPALGSLYFGLAKIWHFPLAEEIVGTIALIDTFLGIVLHISNQKYYKNEDNFDGDVIVTPEDGGNKVTLAFNEAPEDLVDKPGKHSMELKINRMRQ